MGRCTGDLQRPRAARDFCNRVDRASRRFKADWKDSGVFASAIRLLILRNSGELSFSLFAVFSISRFLNFAKKYFFFARDRVARHRAHSLTY